MKKTTTTTASAQRPRPAAAKQPKATTKRKASPKTVSPGKAELPPAKIPRGKRWRQGHFRIQTTAQGKQLVWIEAAMIRA